MSTSKKIVYIAGIFLIIFVITMIIVFCVVGDIPDTLVGCVFGACTGEFGILGWIKTTKEKNKLPLEEILPENPENEVINEEDEMNEL